MIPISVVPRVRVRVVLGFVIQKHKVKYFFIYINNDIYSISNVNYFLKG